MQLKSHRAACCTSAVVTSCLISTEKLLEANGNAVYAADSHLQSLLLSTRLFWTGKFGVHERGRDCAAACDPAVTNDLLSYFRSQAYTASDADICSLVITQVGF
jgi:hypothetical protein